MQLEIKTVIDFGDQGPNPGDMNDILRFVTVRLDAHVLKPVCNTYDAKATTLSGWTSSGDDEDEDPADPDTYEVVKFYQDQSKEADIMLVDQTLAQAKKVCGGPDSSGPGWFLGFRKE